MTDEEQPKRGRGRPPVTGPDKREAKAMRLPRRYWEALARLAKASPAYQPKDGHGYSLALRELIEQADPSVLN